METTMVLGLTMGAWVTIATILTMFVLMSHTKIPADMVFLGGMAVFLLAGVLPEEEIIAGFSSPSVVNIGALFIMVAGLVHTGVIQWIIKYVLGVPSSYPKAIVRLMSSVAFLSSFMSNTVVVALFLNVVKTWAKKLNISPSRLFIPLSYASGMGGVCTLIGTPPNMIVSGMYAKESGEAMNVFVTTIPGLFCLVVGVLSILALRRLLPERKSPNESFEQTGDYTAELVVPALCDSVGRTVKEAGLVNVRGGYLVEIVRFDKEIICPVPEDEFIIGGDRLVYTGQIDEILELKRTHGLVNATHPVFTLSDIDKSRKLRTASIYYGSSLINQKMSENDFEADSNTVLVAVARRGERLQGSPRDITLALGDTLLLECPRSQKTMEEKGAKAGLRFFDSEDIPNIGGMTLVSMLIVVGMLLLSTFNVLSLLQCSFLAALAMILTRCCSVEQAQKSIDWNVLMIFASSVCLGTAIEHTGIAQMIAENILNVCGTNALFALIAICFVATFITEFISNTAAAAMFFPIAYQTAITLEANPVTFCLCLMIAASSSFATPIGSPTHMLVYGMGGYCFTDFMKIGLLMNLIILAANIFIVTLLFPL